MILEIKIKATINKQNIESMIKVPVIQQIKSPMILEKRICNQMTLLNHIQIFPKQLIIAQDTLKNLKMTINNKEQMNTD